MHEISKPGAANLVRVLANATEWALFIDIDGTLLDMAPRPDAAVVPAGLVGTLRRLVERFGGAVALITGRRVSDADRLFAPLRLVTSGVHGTEARTRSGGEIAMLAAPVPSGMLQAVHAIAGLSPGILVEEKGAGVAVHYRNAPQMRPAIERDLARIVHEWEGFAVRSGRKVLELVRRGHSKGTGVGSLMHLPVFSGRRPIMIGDDHGDEPAMHMAQRLGGLGLRVAGEHFNGRSADFDSTAGVRAWLTAVAAEAPAQAERTPPTG
jgi:trehalose 6-phosphate phosphatase